MLNYKQIWYGIKPTRWLIKFNLTALKAKASDTNESSNDEDFKMKAGWKLYMMNCFSFKGMMPELWYLDRRVSTSSAQIV